VEHDCGIVEVVESYRSQDQMSLYPKIHLRSGMKEELRVKVGLV
jgi:hypothetical protein